MDDPITAQQSQEHTEEFNSLTSPPVEEPALLAGKYKTVDELVQGYTELSKKLGTPNPVVETPVVETEVTVETLGIDEPTLLSKEEQHVGLSLEDYLSSIAQGEEIETGVRDKILANHNLQDTTLSALEQGSINNHKQGMVDLYNAAGGKEGFERLKAHVTSTYTDDQIAELETAIRHPTTGRLVLDSLMKDMGTVPAAPPSTTNITDVGLQPYKSQAELNEAMTNPIYTNPDHPEHQDYVKTLQDRFGISSAYLR